MTEQKPIIEFEVDFLRRAVFSFVEIPQKWCEGDHIAELDSCKILDALAESADYVDEEIFEDGGPGLSGSYYEVYAQDEAAFKKN